MATLNGPMDFTGSLGKFSAYKRPGSDKTYVKRKGGPSKKQIKTAPQFERTRQNNSEFAACTMLTAGIRVAVFPVKHLADSDFTGVLNGLGKKLQMLDETGERGKRSLLLSRHRYMLAGFNFNVNHAFDTVVRHPLTVKTFPKTARATVTIPRLVPGVSLNLPWKAPYYRFIVSLGPVGDVEFKAGGFKGVEAGAIQFHYTEWQHTDAPAAEQTINIKLSQIPGESASVLLAVGIEMGMPDRFNEIGTVRRAGAARILALF